MFHVSCFMFHVSCFMFMFMFMFHVSCFMCHQNTNIVRYPFKKINRFFTACRCVVDQTENESREKSKKQNVPDIFRYFRERNPHG